MFPTTFPHGERSITTIGNGVAMARGRRSRTPCGPRSGTRPAGTKAHAAIIDSQTVKTTEMGGPRGYDAGKRIKGRKRHILVDTLGLLLALVVHSQAFRTLPGAKPRWRRSWAGSAVAADLDRWGIPASGRLGQEFRRLDLELVRKPKELRTFQVLPHRWKVERTLGWSNRFRRLSKDYEHDTGSS